MDSPLAAPIGRVARQAGLLGIALAVTSAVRPLGCERL